MSKGPSRTAIIYDFDGTLAPGNVQEHSFIPNMGLSTGDFWDEVKRQARKHDADEILTYMWQLLETARGNGIAVTREVLRKHGEDTPLFAGLDSWFDRVDAYGIERGLAIEHYIISSGTLEMIEGSRIAGRFREIYASKFIYDDQGVAVWPGVAIDYTSKTQFLFRINKGIDNTWDNEAINRWMPMEERPIPFEQMIFVGDGATDIPAMKMVRHQGGHSIAVFDPAKWEAAASQAKIHRLIAEDRVHFVAPADYSEGSLLSVTVQGILGRLARAAGYRGAPNEEE
jgi:phosphoserine phosphatase